jgi:hypothetical protein
MSTFEFLGCLTAELFEVLKGRLTRSLSDDWDLCMTGFANDKKIACPICEKYVSWIPEAVDPAAFKKSSLDNVEQNHAR